MEKSKIIRIELKGWIFKRFEIIKSRIGIQNDAEVIQYLIQQYYQEYLETFETSEKEELKKDKAIIKKFIDKYGDEWRKLGED